MGQSNVYKLPWPEPTAPADVPADLQALADKVDSVIGSVPAALPSSPVAGQRALYSPVAGVVWELVYDGARWAFLGGAPMTNAVPTAEATTSLAYTNLTTAGPQLTVPLAGDYTIGMYAQASGVSAEMARIAVKIGAAAAADADGAFGGFNANGGQALYRPLQKTGLAAGTVLLLQYRTSAGGNISFSQRLLTLTPTRI